MFLNDNDENSVRNLLFALETDSVFKSLLIDTGIYSIKKHDFLKTPKNKDIKNMLSDITEYIKSAETDKPLKPLYDRLSEKYHFINPVSFCFYTALTINRHLQCIKLSYSGKANFNVYHFCNSINLNEEYMIKYYPINHDRILYIGEIYKVFSDDDFPENREINCRDVTLKMREWYDSLPEYSRKVLISYGGTSGENKPVKNDYKKIMRFISDSDIPACEMFFSYLPQKYGGSENIIRELKEFKRFYNELYPDTVKVLTGDLRKHFNFNDDISLSDNFITLIKGYNPIHTELNNDTANRFMKLLKYEYDDELFIYQLCDILYNISLDSGCVIFYPYNLHNDMEAVIKQITLIE